MCFNLWTSFSSSVTDCSAAQVPARPATSRYPRPNSSRGRAALSFTPSALPAPSAARSSRQATGESSMHTYIYMRILTRELRIDRYTRGGRERDYVQPHKHSWKTDVREVDGARRLSLATHAARRRYELRLCV